MAARILIADSKKEARAAVRAILCDEPLVICGEADNGLDALDRFRELQPDLVILGLLLPRIDGIAVAYEIRRIAPHTKIVFFSLHDLKSPATTRVLAADAYVVRTDPSQLLQEVRRLLHPNAASAS